MEGGAGCGTKSHGRWVLSVDTMRVSHFFFRAPPEGEKRGDRKTDATSRRYTTRYSSRSSFLHGEFLTKLSEERRNPTDSELAMKLLSVSRDNVCTPSTE